MQLSDFDYKLPPELIAQYPPKIRGDSRLLVLERDKGKIEHRHFRDIGDYLTPDDILVLNDTKVLPARLRGRKERTGGKIEILLLGKLESNLWEVLVKPARRVRPGTKIIFKKGDLEAEVVEEREERRVLKFSYKGSPACRQARFEKVIEEIGEVPLPPYIKRACSSESIDRRRYQTVYAQVRGAVAAPTAGLHFTDRLLRKLKNKGVNIANLTLHISLGTFQPVRDLSKHRIYPEYYEIPKETLEVIKRAKIEGRRIVAVGTSTARALESFSLLTSNSQASIIRNWADLFIFPGYKFNMVRALITNFHLPKSSLLMLVSAFAGREIILKAYSEAIERKYKFYSYGDAMLII
jgi:S-adenosylmethionine:tRNA ribosyltransferase-isomerase